MNTPSRARDIKNRIFSTLKNEVQAINNLRAAGSDIVKAVQKLSSRRGKIVITGVGKSAFVGMKIAATLTSLGHHAFFLHPVEALHGDSGMLIDGDVVIAISFSGESSEVLKVLRHIKKTFAVDLIAITGHRNSSLSKLSDVSIVLRVGHEGSPNSLAPMASTTASLVVGDLLAVGLVDPRKYNKMHFAKFHPGGNLGLELRVVEEVMTTGKNIPTISENAPFKKAIVEINNKKKGIVGVTNKSHKLVGVVTDGDVRRFFSKHDSSARVLTKDVMTVSPKVISPKESLKKTLEIMENSKITSLFVTEKDNAVLGLIHLHDIIEATT